MMQANHVTSAAEGQLALPSDQESIADRAVVQVQRVGYANILNDLVATEDYLISATYAVGSLKPSISCKGPGDSKRIIVQVLCLDGTRQSQTERSWMRNEMDILKRLPSQAYLPRLVLGLTLGAEQFLRNASDLVRAFPHLFAGITNTTKKVLCAVVESTGVALRAVIKRPLSDRGLFNVCQSIASTAWSLLQNGVVCTDLSTSTIQWDRTHQRAVLTQLGRAITVGHVSTESPSLDNWQVSLARELDATSIADSIPCSDVSKCLMGVDEAVAVDRFPPESREAMGAGSDGSARLGGMLAFQLGTVIFELATGTPFAAALQQEESGVVRTTILRDGWPIPEPVAKCLDKRPAAMQQLVCGLLDRRPSRRLKVSDAVQRLQLWLSKQPSENVTPAAFSARACVPQAVGSVYIQDTQLLEGEPGCSDDFIGAQYFRHDDHRTSAGSDTAPQGTGLASSSAMPTRPTQIPGTSAAVSWEGINACDEQSAGELQQQDDLYDDTVESSQDLEMADVFDQLGLGNSASTHELLCCIDRQRSTINPPRSSGGAASRHGGERFFDVDSEPAAGSETAAKPATQSNHCSRDFGLGASAIMPQNRVSKPRTDSSMGSMTSGNTVASEDRLMRPRSNAFAARDRSELLASIETASQAVLTDTNAGYSGEPLPSFGRQTPTLVVATTVASAAIEHGSGVVQPRCRAALRGVTSRYLAAQQEVVQWQECCPTSQGSSCTTEARSTSRRQLRVRQPPGHSPSSGRGGGRDGVHSDGTHSESTTKHSDQWNDLTGGTAPEPYSSLQNPAGLYASSCFTGARNYIATSPAHPGSRSPQAGGGTDGLEISIDSEAAPILNRARYQHYSVASLSLSPSRGLAGMRRAAATCDGSTPRCMDVAAGSDYDLEQGLGMAVGSGARQDEGDEQEYLDLRTGLKGSATIAGPWASVQERARVEPVGLHWATNSGDSDCDDCLSFCGETRSICGSIGSDSGLGMQHRDRIDMEHAALLPAKTSCSRSRGTGSVSGRLQGNRWKLNRRGSRRDSSMHGKASQSTCEESEPLGTLSMHKTGSKCSLADLSDGLRVDHHKPTSARQFGRMMQDRTQLDGSKVSAQESPALAGHDDSDLEDNCLRREMRPVETPVSAPTEESDDDMPQWERLPENHPDNDIPLEGWMPQLGMAMGQRQAVGEVAWSATESDGDCTITVADSDCTERSPELIGRAMPPRRASEPRSRPRSAGVSNWRTARGAGKDKREARCLSSPELEDDLSGMARGSSIRDDGSVLSFGKAQLRSEWDVARMDPSVGDLPPDIFEQAYRQRDDLGASDGRMAGPEEELETPAGSMAEQWRLLREDAMPLPDARDLEPSVALPAHEDVAHQLASQLGRGMSLGDDEYDDWDDDFEDEFGMSPWALDGTHLAHRPTHSGAASSAHSATLQDRQSQLARDSPPSYEQSVQDPALPFLPGVPPSQQTAARTPSEGSSLLSGLATTEQSGEVVPGTNSQQQRRRRDPVDSVLERAGAAEPSWGRGEVADGESGHTPGGQQQGRPGDRQN